MTPLSNRTRLAQAKRQLRRLEEDELAFRVRIATLPSEARDLSIEWFRRALEEQRKVVQRPESEAEGKSDRR